ncbi:MAG: SRPBCC family protein [Chitinophagales bacterium]|nr:SRPBCC family protein [Chitinophagaceae bacterium]MCB9065019.1 SRPBCC family protein [Chitinophagales bacterium]
MKSTKFTETIIINEAIEQVFDRTQDYENRLDWDPFLISAELMDGAKAVDKGVKAYCMAKNNVGMETVYVSFDRPKVAAVTMTKGPYMFKSFSASWRFKEMGDTQTEVIFVYSFQLRFPFNLFTSLVKSRLRHDVQQRLKGLKGSLETKKK